MKKAYTDITILFIKCLILAILNGYLFNYLNDNYFNFSSNNNGLVGFNELTKAIIILIITPILETYIFQYLITKSLIKLGLKNEILIIIVSSLIFGLFHYYFWLYALAAFFGGIILNTFYHKIKGKFRYYLILMMVFHAFYNLYGYIFVM